MVAPRQNRGACEGVSASDREEAARLLRHAAGQPGALTQVTLPIIAVFDTPQPAGRRRRDRSMRARQQAGDHRQHPPRRAQDRGPPALLLLRPHFYVARADRAGVDSFLRLFGDLQRHRRRRRQRLNVDAMRPDARRRPAATAPSASRCSHGQTFPPRWTIPRRRRLFDNGLDGKRLGVVQSGTIHLLPACLARRHLSLVGSQRQPRGNRQRDRRRRQCHEHIRPLLRVGGDDNEGSIAKPHLLRLDRRLHPACALCAARRDRLRPARAFRRHRRFDGADDLGGAPICGSCSPRLPVR